jgi:polyisoprenoid-binding protein YceI
MNPAPATVTIPGYLAGTWKADPVHCEIAFSIRQVMVSTVRARFSSYDVTIVTSEDPLGSSVTATIDLASIDTGNQKRDNHLRSAEILEIDKHPTMSYRSTSIRQTDHGWVIDGELTLHARTRQVPLAVAVNGFGPGPNGEQRAGFTATTQINRRDFDITIPMGGGGVVSNKVSISLKIDAVLQK